VIVVDASGVLELLLHRPAQPALMQRLSADEGSLNAPALLDVEVCHVLRRCWLNRELSAQRGREALDAFSALPIQRVPHAQLLNRMWQWRTNLSAYDAAYVALAEALDATLITCDRKLAAALQGKLAVEVF